MAFSATRAGRIFFLLLLTLEQKVRHTMTEVTESAEAKQVLESLKAKMLVLKEHL
jgi:hypothetical protein